MSNSKKSNLQGGSSNGASKAGRLAILIATILILYLFFKRDLAVLLFYLEKLDFNTAVSLGLALIATVIGGFQYYLQIKSNSDAQRQADNQTLSKRMEEIQGETNSYIQGVEERSTLTTDRMTDRLQRLESYLTELRISFEVHSKLPGHSDTQEKLNQLFQQLAANKATTDALTLFFVDRGKKDDQKI